MHARVEIEMIAILRESYLIKMDVFALQERLQESLTHQTSGKLLAIPTNPSPFQGN